MNQLRSPQNMAIGKELEAIMGIRRELEKAPAWGGSGRKGTVASRIYTKIVATVDAPIVRLGEAASGVTADESIKASMEGLELFSRDR